MKKNYTSKSKKIKNLLVTTSIIGAAALVMSFGSMFFGPGITNPEPFTAFNGSFPDVDLSNEPYQPAYANVTFNWPLTFTPVPNQSRIVVGQLDGKIYWMDDAQNVTVKWEIVDFSLEVGDAIPVGGIKEVWDGGLLGLEMHPDFGTPGKNFVYIYYTTDSGNPDAGIGGGASGTFGCFNDEFHGNYLNLERFEVDPLNMTFVPNSRDILMKRRMLNSTHRGGAMEFGDDGFLYVATGEQGKAINAQNIIDNLDGGVLRIDVDMDPTKSHAPTRTMPADEGEADEVSGQFYWIPNDNPFVSVTGANFEEYYTVGNRSPHRMSKDSQTGELYIGEVGQSTHEEINVVSSGKNYGWPVWEGNIAPPNYDCGIPMLNGMAHEAPLTAFPRTDAGSIIGGHVYRGTEFTSSIGRFITADWVTQQIFSVDITDGTYETLGTLPNRPISFGENANGDILYLTQGNNVNLLKFVEPGVTAGMPQTLTATGAFTDLQNLTVADGFVPYEMIDPFWSDGAYKKRWLAVPNDGTHDTAAEQIQFSEDGTWIFPVGSVLIKHFDYPVDDNDPNITQKIETRFSIKNSNGNWTFLSYKWNTAQTEADLVDMSTGEDAPVTVTEIGGGTRTITWRYPSTNQCLTCHNDASQGTLGPRTRYLNSDYDYSQHDPSGVVGNQLVTMSYLGMLDQQIEDTDTPNFLTHTSINDTNASLDDKARSYLDLNCAYCHQPANDLRPTFDLRLANSLVETGLLTAGISEPVAAMPSDQKILYPGDASKSQLYHRTNSITPGVMMPYLAKNQVDTEGVALLEEWINQLIPPPLAEATSDVTMGNAPLLVQFTGSNSTGDIVSYEWDFGDGGTSTVADPNYTYNTPGQYTAKLTVTASDNQTDEATIAITVTGGAVNNTADATVNLGLATDAIIVGSVEGGRGVPEDILFDPSTNDYFQATSFNEYGVAFQDNLGTPTVDDAFTWRVDWLAKKQVNYITFGGVFSNQPQPNSLWRISYRTGDTWTMLDEGQGGWLDSGIYEWGGPTEAPIIMDGLRVQVYSDGTNDLVSIHLRGRGGVSNNIDDSNTEPKATLIQYVPDTGAPISEFEYTTNDLEVTFDSSNSTDIDGTIDVYAWDFGDGNTSSDANPIHNYAAPGTYTVTLTVTDNDGLTDDRTQNITVDGVPAIPVAIATSDVSAGAAALTVQFTGSASTDDVGITSYAWDFGDGGTSTEADPTYVYMTPGQYTVTLTVNDIDTNTSTDSLVIIASGGTADNTPNAGINLALLPDAYVSGTVIEGRGNPEDILYDPTSDDYFQTTDFNEYGELRFASLGTPGVDDGFNWQVDWVAPKLVNYVTFGGVFPNQPQPNSLWRISYRVGNDWTILEEGQGGWLDSGIYEWGGATEPGFEMESLRVQIYSDGTNELVSIHLRGRGGVSNNIDDSITEPKATLIQYLPNTGAPESAFDYTANNLEVTFDSSNSTDDVGIVSYTWDFGDGNGSTMDNPSHTYTLAGTYTVTLTVTDGAGLSDISSQQVTVVADNSVPVALATSDVTVGLVPLPIQFIGSNSTDDVGVVSYSWDFGDGGTAIGADPNYTYTTPGQYNAILTVTDVDNNTASTEISIVVSSGIVNNTPNPGLNLALLSDALVDGNIENGRGTPQAILYDPSKDDYFIKTDFNEYGIGQNENLGTPTIDDGFLWEVNWVDRKQVNYITFGGVFANQPQPNSLWRISYRVGNTWTILEEGQGGWLDSGIYEWGGPTEVPMEIDGLKVQVYSDGINDLVSIHLRGRGGISNVINDSGTQTKATLIQYLPQAGAPESAFDYTINDLEVTFDSSTSTDDVGIVSYAWDFGDGNVSTDANPMYTYGTSGTYTVSLTVTDGDGISDTSSIEIMLGNAANEAPVAIIGTSLITGAAPLNENFVGSNSTDDVGIVSYAWDFGDGGTSSLADPTHEYVNPGNYTATLTVTDAEGLTDVATVTIIVTSNVADNAPNAGINLGLAPDAILSGSVTNGRGTPQSILYDPGRDDYFVRTNYNEYGVAFNENLGTPGPEDGFQWQVDWASRKLVNYITFGGVFDNQPQPNSMWRISYRVGNTWTILEEGQAGWIDAGIYEWGGMAQVPLEMDGLRVQVYSDGTNDLISIHLRGRGGVSNSIDDSATQTKATLIQYLPDAGAPESDFDYTIADLEVTFDSSNSSDDMGISGYLWDFGDGNTSTEANPIYEYFQSGTYDVSLTVTDGDGKEDTVTKTITVSGNGKPVAVASSDIDMGAAPLTIQFTGSSSIDDVGVTSYSWDFGDGTGISTDMNPAHEFTTEGVYTVTLTVADVEGLTDETSLTITVNAENVAPVAVASSDVLNGVAPLSVQFMGSNSTDDVAIVSYGWDFGDGGSSTQADPVYEFTAAGSYDVVMTVTDAEGLTDSATITIDVTTANTAPVAIASSDVQIGGAPLTVTFTGSGSTDDVAVVSYSWEFGDGGTSTEADPEHEFTTVGSYDVVLTVIDAEGLSDTATITIEVTAANVAPAAIASSDVQVGEAPLTVTFTGSGSTDDVAVASYSWDFGDGASSTVADPEHEFTNVGSYDVVLTVTDAEGLSDSATITIEVTQGNLTPTAVASANELSGMAPFTVEFSSSGSTDDTGIVSFLWDFGDGSTSTEANPDHEYTEEGTYTVTLTITDDEGAEGVASLEIVVEANETLVEEELEMIVSPNPAVDFIEIVLNGAVAAENIVGFMLHDSAGRLIQQYQTNDISQGTGTYVIPLSMLNNEMYVVTIMLNNADPISKRIVVRK